MPVDIPTSADEDSDNSDNSDFVEVTGYASRADWEDLYLAARKLARKHGISVVDFELEPVSDGLVADYEIATDPE